MISKKFILRYFKYVYPKISPTNYETIRLLRSIE